MNLFSPGEWLLCVFDRVAGLTECLLICDITFQLYVGLDMHLEVNRCIPLDLFMVLFIGLVFRYWYYNYYAVYYCMSKACRQIGVARP